MPSDKSRARWARDRTRARRLQCTIKREAQMTTDEILEELFVARCMLETEMIHNPGMSRNVMAACIKIRRVHGAIAAAATDATEDTDRSTP